MKCRNLYRMLYSKPYYRYNDTSNQAQEEARVTLLDFYALLCTYQPLMQIETKGSFYFGYMTSFVLFSRYLYRADYCSAINELTSIAYRHCVLQPRLYYTLLDILSHI